MERFNRATVALVALVVLLLAASVGPALAAGTPPTNNGYPISLIYTASSGGQPQGAFINGAYVRLATTDCPAPALMLADGEWTYACPPPLKLPWPLPPWRP